MKRLIIAVIAALMCVLMISVYGCSAEGDILGGTTTDAIEKYRSAYDEIADAESITESIEIYSGKLEAYERVTEYKKGEEGYEKTTRTKRLNDLESAEAYSESESEEQVKKAENYAGKLEIDEKYFEDGYKISESQLQATIKSGTVREFLGIDSQLPAPTDEFKVTMSLAQEKLSTITFNYVSGIYNVAISIQFGY